MELKNHIIKIIKKIRDPEKIVFIYLFIKELLENS